MDIKELYWLAGLIEGEGSFGKKHSRITIPQVNYAPLERVQKTFGGKVGLSKRPKRGGRQCFIWYLGGAEARGLMMTIYPLMSPKRQAQIYRPLSFWLTESKRILHHLCMNGHPMTEDNTYVYPDGRKVCRICLKEHWRKGEKTRRFKKHMTKEQEQQWERQKAYKAAHCVNGHLLTPDNIYVCPGDDRSYCRECRRISRGKYHSKTFIPVALAPPKTHCPHGHEYSEDNTYINPKGSKVCRTCTNDRARDFRQAHPGYDGHKKG
jgi:hypothetical protein